MRRFQLLGGILFFLASASSGDAQTSEDTLPAHVVARHGLAPASHAA